MSQDLLLGKTSRDWSRSIHSTSAPRRRATVGKSAAELWDEAESARQHRPVRYMSDPARSASAPPRTPGRGASFAQSMVPAVAGALVAGIVLLPIVRD